MTYNEWKDELKSNLLSVSDSERRRVLDYYAEAYADRRDAGYSEREIIEDFGAPYDAAQRILSDRSSAERTDSPFDDDRERRRADADRRREDAERRERERDRREDRRREREREREYERDRRERDRRERELERERQRDYDDDYYDDRHKKSNSVLFVIVCIILAIPLFGVVMALVGITIGFCVAPFGLIIAGACSAGGGVGMIVGGHLSEGLLTIGTGAVSFGAGLVLMPVFFFIVKLLWKLFKSFMGWFRSLFDEGRRYI